MILLVTFLKYVIYLRLCKGNSAATGKDSYGFTTVFFVLRAHCLLSVQNTVINESLVNLEAHCFLVSLLTEVFPARILILKESPHRKLRLINKD